MPWIARNDHPLPPEIPEWNGRVGGPIDEVGRAFYERIAFRYEDRHSVRFRTTISTPVPESAIITGVGLGLFELHVNGVEIDAGHCLKPVKTLYQDHVAVRSYNIGALLRPGENVIGIECAHGWFSPKSRWRGWRMPWNGIPCANLTLTLSFPGGVIETFETDASWRWAPGYTISSCIYDGETTDLRNNPPASVWAAPGFDDGAWQPVALVDPPVRNIVPALAPDNAVHETLAPVCTLFLEDGRVVYDFGQNIAGRIRLTSGDRILHCAIRHTEEILSDGGADDRSLWGADQRDDLWLDPHSTYAPRFTIHGFRYAELTRLDGTPLPERVVAEFVYADVPSIGTFECGHPLLNHIHACTVRSQKGCLQMGVPVDCTQRPERLGWLGDAHVVVSEAMDNFDLRDFHAGWLRGIAAQQAPSGDIPHVSPRPSVHGDICWSAGYVFILWEHYRRYGDLAILREHLPHVRRYLAYLASTRRPDGSLPPSRYGDWYSHAQLSRDPAWRKGAPAVASSAYYHRLLSILFQMESLLDETHTLLPPAVFDPGTEPESEAGSRIAALALRLACDFIPGAERPAALDALRAELASAGYHVLCGILGTQALFQVLGEAGDADTAFRLLTAEGVPGYAAMLKDKTTLCEEWSAKSGSFNHVMFGSVDAWFHEYLCGIQIDYTYPETPILLRPQPVPECRWARATRRLPDGGLISSEWELTPDGQVRYTFKIPAGHNVRLFVDGVDCGVITAGVHTHVSQSI